MSRGRKFGGCPDPDGVGGRVAAHLGDARRIARRLAWRLGLDPDAAESDALYKLFLTARSYDPGRGVPFAPLAMRAISRGAAGAARTQSPGVKGLGCFDPPSRDEPGGSPDVDSMLRRLGGRSRAAVVLRFGLGTGERTVKEVGEALGVATSRASTILASALEHLRTTGRPPVN